MNRLGHHTVGTLLAFETALHEASEKMPPSASCAPVRTFDAAFHAAEGQLAHSTEKNEGYLG